MGTYSGLSKFFRVGVCADQPIFPQNLSQVLIDLHFEYSPENKVYAFFWSMIYILVFLHLILVWSYSYRKSYLRVYEHFWQSLWTAFTSDGIFMIYHQVEMPLAMSIILTTENMIISFLMTAVPNYIFASTSIKLWLIVVYMGHFSCYP